MTASPILETRDLRLVQAIVEAGGAARAARVLHVSQSAVSHQLRGLEERLGTAVFDRSGRTLRLTRAGERIADIARDVLGSLERAESELLRGLSAHRETLRVASECFTAYLWLPRALSVLAREHPNVDLTVVPEPAGGMREAFAARHVDLALCVAPPGGTGLASLRLFVDELVLVVAPNHPLAHKPWIDGAQLGKETLVLHETTRAQQQRVARILFPRGGGFARVVRIPMSDAILELVRAGVGVSILPRASVQHYVERGDVTPLSLTKSGLKRTWTGYFRRGTALEPAIVALLEAAKLQAPPTRRRVAHR